MNIQKVVVGDLRENCYVVKSGNKCFVVDPGDEAEKILGLIGDSYLELILLTHGHFDHILSLEVLAKKFPKAKIYISKEDLKLVKDPAWQNDYAGGWLRGVDLSTNNVKEDDYISFDKYKIKVIETPGHSTGSVCYLVGDTLFSGDTLFYLTIGRTDLPSGDKISMNSSLKKLAGLPEETKVYPGHSKLTTIGEEKQNGYLKDLV